MPGTTNFSSPSFFIGVSSYPPSPLVTFLLCVCVCEEYNDYIIYYFGGANVYIIVDLVKCGVLTFVSEIQYYKNKGCCYYSGSRPLPLLKH